MAISKYTAAMVAVLLAALAAGSTAQQVPSCASKLVPCAGYLNSTTPPASCCSQLKEAVTNELACLCSIFNSPDLLKAFNINLTQALELPKHCGINSSASQSLCSKSSSGSTPAAKTPAASTSLASGGGSSAKSENSAYRRATWIGMPGLVSSLLLFWWSLLA